VTTPPTIPARFLAQAERLGDRVAFTTHVALGAREDRTWTWREWRDDAMALAALFTPGERWPTARIAIMAGNTPVWPIAEMGAMLAGLPTVGIVPRSVVTHVAAVLDDADCAVAFCDDAEHLATLCEAAQQRAFTLIVHDAGPEAEASVRARWPSVHGFTERFEPRDGARGVVVLWEWERALALGRSALDHVRPSPRATVATAAAALDPAAEAIVIHTSGSTGAPKGAVLSHRAIAANADAIVATLGATDADVQLSVLPYAHAAERIFGLHSRITAGMSCALVPDASRLWDACRLAQPTIFGGLPRLHERLHDALLGASRAATGDAGAAWERLLDTGRTRARLRAAGAAVPAPLEVEWQAARAVAAPVLAWHLGPRVRLATSGGAALPVAVAETLDACGLTVLGAYGQTEHLSIAMHRPDTVDFASAGPPMPGTELRIADDGEILVRRGAMTFDRYLHREAETAAAFTADGAWLRTGDLGEIDARGRLRITGRIKELIALGTGKKVAPAPIEARLAADPWIAQAMLAGEGRKYVAALVVPRATTVTAWARDEVIDGDFATLARHPRLRERLAAAIDAVNATLAPAERVARFAIVPEEFTVADGTLTPTMKLRRATIARRHAALLETLWD
jgi:long-chain acyl-CoA synthetase